MKKPVKCRKFVKKRMQARYLSATSEQKQALQMFIEAERERQVEKMARKGYRLEAVVGEVYGIFALPEAQGKVRVEHATSET